MEKKNNSLIIIILFVIILGLGGFIVYDKVLKSDDIGVIDNSSHINNNSNNKVNETKNDDFSKLFAAGGNFRDFDEDGLKIMIEESYLQYLPEHLDKNKKLAKSYNTSELTDEELSQAVWKYILKSDKGQWPKSMDTFSIDRFLKSYNLQNREIKELKMDKVCDAKSCNIMDLKRKDNNYVADILPTEYSLSEYRVENVTFNEKNNEIDVYFFRYFRDIPSIYKVNSGVATYKIIGPYLGGYPCLALERVKFN